MEIREILDAFARYTEYDRKSEKTQISWDDYEYQLAGDKIQNLIGEYDQTGILSVLYAKKILLKMAGKKKFTIEQYLTDQKIQEKIKRDEEMYRILCDSKVHEAAAAYIQSLSQLVVQVTGKKLLGCPVSEESEKVFIDSVEKVVEDIGKCRVDIYHNSGRKIGILNKFNTRILVFERMGDCILWMDNQKDGIYLCYINQYGSADGYFAFVIKSNGNLFSINERIPEEFIGQHEKQMERNARWSENHADSLFPYTAIFSYASYDGRGNATEYTIHTDKLDFLNLGEPIYQPLLIAMLLLKSKWEDREITGEPLYINSLIPDNFIGEHPGAEVAILEKNPIAVRNKQFHVEFDKEKLLSGTYNLKYSIKSNEASILWTSLYGSGFEPDYRGLLSTEIPALTDFKGSGKNRKFFTEFIGTQEVMEREVYRKIRLQLANHIEFRMMEEYDKLGIDRINAYLAERLQKKKEPFLEIVCMAAFEEEYPEISKSSVKWSDLEKNLIRFVKFSDEEDLRSAAATFNTRYDMSGQILDNVTGKRCAQYASMKFQNWKQLEAFIGEKLPPIYQGWDVNGSMGSNGNSYLDVTDAVGSIESPLCMRLRPDGKYYVPLRTKMVMGFSKATWKSVYQTWMEKNGYEYLLKEKKRQEKENRMKEKSRLLMMETIPFEESELGRSVETIASTANNFKQVREKAKELYHLSREIRAIGSMWNREENIINQLIIRIPVKNNKKIIHELDEAGFDKQERSLSSEGWDVQYKVHI